MAATEDVCGRLELLQKRLKEERLFVKEERDSIRRLSVSVSSVSNDLFQTAWKTRQHWKNLERLIQGSRVFPSECSHTATCIEKAAFEDASKHLGYLESRYGEFLARVRLSPELLASILNSANEAGVDVTHLSRMLLSTVYGSCLFKEDENLALTLLKELMRLQVFKSDNFLQFFSSPKSSSNAFCSALRLFNELLFSTKLYLTAALHGSCMQIIVDDGFYLDYEENKVLSRFPTKSIMEKFGEPGTPEARKKINSYMDYLRSYLLNMCSRFLKSLRDKIYCFPSSLRWLVYQLYIGMCDKNHDTDYVKSVLGYLLMAYFVCPAIINPEPYGINSDATISEIARYNLSQVASILRSMALTACGMCDVKLQPILESFEKGIIVSFVDSVLDGAEALSPHGEKEILTGLTRSAMLMTENELRILVLFIQSVYRENISKNTDAAKILQLIELLPAAPRRWVNKNVQPRETTSLPHSIYINVQQPSGGGPDPPPRPKKNRGKIKKHNSMYNPGQNELDPSIDKADSSSMNEQSDSSGDSSNVDEQSTLMKEMADMIDNEPVLVITYDNELQDVPGMLSEEKVLGLNAHVPQASTFDIDTSEEDKRKRTSTIMLDALKKAEIGGGGDDLLDLQEILSSSNECLDSDSGTTPDITEQDVKSAHSANSDSIADPFLPVGSGAGPCPAVANSSSSGLPEANVLDNPFDSDFVTSGPTASPKQQRSPTGLLQADPFGASPFEPSTSSTTTLNVDDLLCLEEKTISKSTPTHPSTQAELEQVPALPPKKAHAPSAFTYTNLSSGKTGPSQAPQTGLLIDLGEAEEKQIDHSQSSAVQGAHGGAQPMPTDGAEVQRLSVVSVESVGNINGILRSAQVPALLEEHENDVDVFREEKSADDAGSTDSDDEFQRSFTVVNHSSAQTPTREAAAASSLSTSLSDSQGSAIFDTERRSRKTTWLKNKFSIGKDKLASGIRSSRTKSEGQTLRKAIIPRRKGSHPEERIDLSKPMPASLIVKDIELGDALPRKSSIEISEEILQKYRNMTSAPAGLMEDPSSCDDPGSPPPIDEVYFDEEHNFLDAKRKLRIVLCTADRKNFPSGISKHDQLLTTFLQAQLAEAINLQDRSFVAQLHETLRSIRQLPAGSCEKLLTALTDDYQSRSAYIAYMTRSKRGLLSTVAAMEQLLKKVERDRSICSKYFNTVCVRLFLETPEKKREIAVFSHMFINTLLVDEKCVMLDQFLDKVSNDMISDPTWSSSTTDQWEDACIATERAVMSKIYKDAFYPNGIQDVENDKIYHQHTARLAQTITVNHKALQVSKVYQKEAPWPSAQTELLMVNAYKTASDKVNCVHRCCVTIMNLLSMASDREAPGADDFLPVLVYVVIRANPPNLMSTKQYIQSFYEQRLTGEQLYCWMQFCAALEFIKSLR